MSGSGTECDSGGAGSADVDTGASLDVMDFADVYAEAPRAGGDTMMLMTVVAPTDNPMHEAPPGGGGGGAPREVGVI
mgnify:CR=1 FL=1